MAEIESKLLVSIFNRKCRWPIRCSGSHHEKNLLCSDSGVGLHALQRCNKFLYLWHFHFMAVASLQALGKKSRVVRSPLEREYGHIIEMKIYRLQDTIWCLTKSARFDYLPINCSLCFQLKFCRSRWSRAGSVEKKCRDFVHSQEDATRVNNKVNSILNKSEKGFPSLDGWCTHYASIYFACETLPFDFMC